MAESTQKAETPTYHIDRLLAESDDRFGVPSHVVAGALASSRKQNFTLEEVQSQVDKWLKRPVEVDNPIGQYAEEA